MRSRTLKYTLFAAILVAAILVVSIVPVAMAKSDTAHMQTKPVDGAAIDSIIEKLEPHVRRCDDGTFRLDIPKGVKIDKTSTEFKIVLAGMEAVNSLIQEGIFVTRPDLSVYPATGGQFVLQSNNRNEYKPRWYGFELWLSHSVCQYLESGAALADMVALVCAATGVGAPIAIAIIPIVTTGAVLVGIWDNGCGVHMKFAGLPPSITLFYIAAQTCD